MVPTIEKPAVSLTQKRLALLVAGAADFVQIVAAPAFFEGAISPFENVLDVIVALLLMAICGFRWQWVLAFAMELIPGFDLLPTWTMVVALMTVHPEYVRGYGDVNAEPTEEPERQEEGSEEESLVNVRGVVVPPVRPRALTHGQ
ncbi:MAG TPA: hypothetical protein VH253_13470 [Phycisphaerae bacterium]|nr:hypothetical protein [Phycisphaerae bacterium]